MKITPAIFMPQTKRCIFILKYIAVSMVIVFLCWNHSFAQKVVIKVAYDHWPPWKIISSGQIDGIDARILYAIEKKTNLKFEFVTAPWRRCIELLKTGEADMITSFIENEGRRNFACYISPHYYIDTVRFYGLKSQEFQLQRYEDLYKFRIGGVKGAHYYDRFDQDKKMDTEMVAHEKQLVKMLVSERIDLIIDWAIPFEYLIHKMDKQPFIRKYEYNFFASDNEIEKYVKQSASFFAFSRKSKKLQYKAEFEAILKSMIKNKEINKIIDSFIHQNMDGHESFDTHQ